MRLWEKEATCFNLDVLLESQFPFLLTGEISEELPQVINDIRVGVGAQHHFDEEIRRNVLVLFRTFPLLFDLVKEIEELPGKFDALPFDFIEIPLNEVRVVDVIGEHQPHCQGVGEESR